MLEPQLTLFSRDDDRTLLVGGCGTEAEESGAEAEAEGAEESVASLAEELESCLFGLRHRRGEMSDKKGPGASQFCDKSQAHSIDTTMVDNGEDLHI